MTTLSSHYLTSTVQPKVIWEETRRKVSISYNGMLQIQPPNCPFPFDDNHPHLIRPSGFTQPEKRHADSLSRFATIHFVKRQTDR